MPLNNLRVSTQLRLGLGLIMVLVVALGALAWVQSDRIWLTTKDLYDHPLTVRRAIGGLSVDLLQMRTRMQGLPTAANEQEIQTTLQQIDVFDADATRQIDVLYDRYLGDRQHLDDVAAAVVQFRTVRAESIRLLREGKAAELIERLGPNGAAGLHVAKMLACIKVIDDFALNKGDRFYRDATELNDTLNRNLAVIVAVILLVSMFVSYLLLQGIKGPIEQLTAATEQFRQGKMDTRCGYVSANEFGTLSASFNAMADTIETETRLNEQAAQLAGVMLRETEARAFFRALLRALVEHTGSEIGAVYLLNTQKTEFEHVESVGLGAGGRASFSAVAPEGEFGLALATGQIQRIADIPEDTRFTFATVGGEFKPREIVTIPLLAEHTAIAVVSLASIRGYDAGAIRLVKDVLIALTARTSSVLAHQQVQQLAERLDHQNRELTGQQQELIAQSRELAYQNTELEIQKRRLDEANRLKSAFLSNMSHELRTPLNSVIALSGVLSRRLATTIPEEEHSYLDVIERNGRQLLSLINDVLDLSRIEAGREEIGAARFSIRALVDEVVAMLEPQAQEKAIALRNQVDDSLPLVHSDPVKCRHILQNLVGNAVKFTEAGSVEISAGLVNDDLHVTVHDTGIGIAADQLTRVFDEFRQVDGSASRKYGGTGLGLAIARKYAILLHGSITVESTPGQGSTFTLTLPLTLSLPGSGADAATMSAGDSRVATAGQGVPTAGRGVPTTEHGVVTAGQGPCILLVEDSEPAVIQVTDILTRNGYRVQVARNGKEALEQVEQSLPDAVILDLMMPEVDGFHVLNAIRGVERTAHLPVLILSAKHVTHEELSVLRNNHIHELIRKGDISTTELLAAVATMVAPPLEKPAPPARPQAHKPRTGKPVILVVEDDPDSLRTARALLEERYQVIEAEDGRAGIEQARQHQPDLILMDLAMPVMDGFAALAAIREDDTLRDIPVVAVTARAMKGDREEILARGFDGYVSKPIDEELLLLTVLEALRAG